MSAAATRLLLAGWMAAWLLGTLPGAAAAQANSDAAAATLTDRAHRYQLLLPEGWVTVPRPGAGSVLAGFEHTASGAVAAIARIDYPNTRAWRRKTRGAYYDEIEAGLRAATTGYERLHARTRSLSSSRVPALDLGFRHELEGGKAEVVLMRFVFFRSYSLALTMRIPEHASRRHRRASEKARASFGPYFGPSD